MRLSNLEEGSYNNAPEPKKMQVTVADKKANTEAWKRYQAGDSRYEFKNPTTEAEQEKAFLAIKLATKLTSENLLILNCDEDRSQLKNKAIVTKRFLDFIKKVRLLHQK